MAIITFLCVVIITRRDLFRVNVYTCFLFGGVGEGGGYFIKCISLVIWINKYV